VIDELHEISDLRDQFKLLVDTVQEPLDVVLEEPSFHGIDALVDCDSL
jgi:hypothetical protein